MPKYEVEVKRTGKLIIDAESAELARINAEFYGNDDVDWEDWFSAENVQPINEQGNSESKPLKTVQSSKFTIVNGIEVDLKDYVDDDRLIAILMSDNSFVDDVSFAFEHEFANAEEDVTGDEVLENVIANQVTKRVRTEQQEVSDYAPLISADILNWFGPYFRGEWTDEDILFAGVEITGDWQDVILHSGDVARVLITTRGSLVTEWMLPCYQKDSKAVEAVKRAEARLTALYEKALATYYKEAYAEIRHCGDCPQHGICSMQAIYYPRMIWIRDSYFHGMIPGVDTPEPETWGTPPEKN